MKDNRSLIEEIEKNKFLLVLLEEEMYIDKIEEIAKSLEKSGKKICYICLSKPYKEICDELKKRNINIKNFYFIDVLSSYYGKIRSIENCVFLSSPLNLLEIKSAVSKAVKDKKCSVIIFDTISTMLIYQETSKIVRFTHDFLSEERERSKILYLVLKHDSIPMEENEKLIKDLNMFADKTIDFIARIK
jgi:archaellum biogenesis ATPase FlaH